MILLQTAVTAAAHPRANTAARWVWMLPLLPLLGFVVNGWLSIAGSKLGPADPNMPHPADHDTHGTAALVSHAEDHGAVGDDHHAVKRHRYAGIVSIVGPGVLVLAFLLAASIFRAMLGADMSHPFVQTY